MEKVQLSLSCKNQEREKSLTVIIEPWAEAFELSPGQIFRARISCEYIKEIETDIGEETISIYVWEGCEVRVSIDGVDRTPSSFEVPIPPM